MKRSPGPSTTNRDRSVLSSFDCIKRWVHESEPDADLVIHLPLRGPALALRRQDRFWTALTLPPVPIDPSARLAFRIDLQNDRRHALDDLLFSLGYRYLMGVPLGPRAAGTLLLGRVGSAFEEQELSAEARRAHRLGKQLALPGEQVAASTGQEVGPSELLELFNFVQELTHSESVSAVAELSASTLERLLHPLAGAVELRAEVSGAAFCSFWPQGLLGAEAKRRLDSQADATPAVGPTWLRIALPHDAGVVALAWAETVPERAPRIIEAISTSIPMALARLQMVRQREDRLVRTVIDSLPMGVALLGSDGRIRLLNSAAPRLLGEDRRLGDRLGNIGDIELGDSIERASAGEPQSLQLLTLGDRRDLALRMVPVARRGGDHAREHEVLLIVDDVTESRRRQEQLAQMEKLSAMGTLIGGIVHEVNNPLTTVIGYSQLLRAAPDAPRREAWVETIQSEAERCKEIVAGMLSFARRHQGERGLISPIAIAEKALSLTHHSLRIAQIEASLECDPKTPSIEGDGDALLRVLINLVTNALHAMENFDGPRRLRVEVQPVAEQLEIVVSDTGPGIPPEYKDKLFDPFFTTKPDGKGTGLGLSLAASTMSDHGGTIEVVSAVGRGASFILRIPLRRSDPDATTPPG